MGEAEDLRRYIEQLRELGETEVTLDSLTASEARHLLGASRERPDPARGSPPKRVREAAEPHSGTGSTDWRAALRAAGDEAPTGVTKAEPVAPAAGLVVNTPSADIFSAQPEYGTLEDVAAAVADCRRCALYQAALNPVPGEGNPRAELVCVGEGPGATEDQTGRPFVGAAGKLLGDILAAIKLAREDVYICNVVKHRPPGNRTPLPDEVAACRPWLARQLEIIRPKVILALGSSAAQTLLNTKLAIGKLRGSVHRYNGTPLIVTYHPAALLRNPAWKRPTWEDVQLVRRILDGSASG
jgi:DNA polymerase